MNFPPARQRFYQEITQPEARIDLAAAALYIAQEAYPALDPAIYLNALDAMASEVRPRLPAERYPLKVIQTLNQYLFETLGFAGNSLDYYDPDNSYLNQVLDRRLGIPITLALVYLEVARRINFPMEGIGMPGHFLIRPAVEEMTVYVDPFNRGEVLFAADCQEKLKQLYGRNAPWRPEFLAPVTAKPFLARLLMNLKLIYLNQRHFQAAVPVMDQLLLLDPERLPEYRDRGLAHYQLNQWSAARQDLEHYLFQHPDPPDAAAIQQLLEQITG